MQYECLIATSYLKLRRLCPAQTPKQLRRDKSRNYGSKKAFGWSQARKWKPVVAVVIIALPPFLVLLPATPHVGSARLSMASAPRNPKTEDAKVPETDC